MPAEAYTAVPSTGKLKLKGVSDGRIDKKKKKKRPKPEADSSGPEVNTSAKDTDTVTDNSVVLKSLEDEDAQIETQRRKDSGANSGSKDSTEEQEENNVEEMNKHLKTASELRFEEQRRKRLEERLKREGVKTHKQRVEELNRYLSGLSEHHDMPKIGPG